MTCHLRYFYGEMLSLLQAIDIPPLSRQHLPIGVVLSHRGGQQWGVTWSRKLPGAAEGVSSDCEVVSPIKGAREDFGGLSATVVPWATGPYYLVLSTVEHCSVHEIKAEVNAAKNGDVGKVAALRGSSFHPHNTC